MSYFQTRLAVPARDDVTVAEINYVTNTILKLLENKKAPVTDDEIEEILLRHGLKFADHSIEADIARFRWILCVSKEGAHAKI